MLVPFPLKEILGLFILFPDSGSRLFTVYMETKYFSKTPLADEQNQLSEVKPGLVTLAPKAAGHCAFHFLPHTMIEHPHRPYQKIPEGTMLKCTVSWWPQRDGAAVSLCSGEPPNGTGCFPENNTICKVRWRPQHTVKRHSPLSLAAPEVRKQLTKLVAS